MNENRSKFEIRITKWNLLVSLLIVVLRAVQPNAQPMNEWSAFSWFLMTLPFMYGFYLFGLFLILKLICEIGISLLDKRR